MWVKEIARRYDNEELSTEDERKIFDALCEKIVENPRHYLDELDRLYILEFSFFDYNESRRVKSKRVYK